MYVELHAHSAFSFLDGASLPDELAGAAAELGYGAMALTDHNGVSGSMEFAQAAAPLGLRAIHGAEIDLDDGRHLTLLVEDEQRLAEPVSPAHAGARAHARGDRRERGGPEARREGRGRHQSLVGTRMRRVDVPPQLPLAAVAEHAGGLVCLSGCATSGVHDEPTLRELLAAFGPDHLRVELQRPFLRHDRARNRALADLAARLKVATVATGNVHAHARERAPLQDAFVALRNHTTLDASEPAAARQLLARARPARGDGRALPRAPRRGGGDRAARRPPEVRPALRPRLPLPGIGGRAGARQARRAVLGEAATSATRRATGTRRAAHARLEEELRVIDSLGLAGFFLLHRDLLELAREVAVQVRGPSTVRALLPPGRGRGSSVSSIVCYLTGLSHIDPVTNELFLGRFLNEELTSLPDIDLDFPRDIREVLIPRVHERYGRERSALVAAFPTFRSRGAIRELGKALGLPPGELERVARGAEPFAVRGVAHDVETGARARARRPAAGAQRPRQPRAVRDVHRGVDGDGQRARSGRRRRADPRRDALRRPARPLGLARAAVRRGLRAAAPPLPALGRHDRLDPPADRLLPGRPGGDGGPPALPVGQGLVRRRGLPEDRPARARDAVGGRALRGVHRAHAQRADRPLADPVRRPRDLRGDPGGRHDGGLPDRVARADAVAVPHAARDPGRPHDPGRDRAARADPRRRRQPVHRAPPADARGPGLRGPLRPPVARAGAARHARHDHLPGPGDRGRDGVRRLLARRGGGAAAGDEPQALGGGDRGLPPAASSRARRAPTASTRRPPSASTR